MSEDADAVAAAVSEGGEPSWHYADGVSGQGDAPDWFKGDKYANVSEQAKAYGELESRFGSFTGAPESYEFKLSEELTSNGIELDVEGDLIKRFSEMAKESNMSQDMANNLVNMFVENQYADSIASEESENARVSEEMKLLGDNAQQRVDNIDKWVTANMPEDMRAGIEEATTTAAGVMAIEKLIAMTRNSALVNEDTTPADVVSDKELQEMQFKRDENGNRLMQVDPEYRKKVEDLYKRKYGDGEHRIVVG